MRVVTLLAGDERVGGGDGGWSVFCFWLTLCAVVVGVALNLVATAVLVTVLQLGLSGDRLQVVGNNTVFGRSVDLGHLIKHNGQLTGWSDEPFSILGDGGVLDFKVDGGNGVSSQLSLSHEGVTISTSSASILADSLLNNNKQLERGALFFDTNVPSFGLPSGVRSLRVGSARTARVTAAPLRQLHLLSGTHAQLLGSEGVLVRGRQLSFSADQQLLLRSVNGSVQLLAAPGSAGSAVGGVERHQLAMNRSGLGERASSVVVNVRTMPWTAGRMQEVAAKTGAAGGATGLRRPAVAGGGAMRLCVCASSGRLFRVPVAIETGGPRLRSPPPQWTCASALRASASNPCL